uniref:Ig-like domain-containing protein n=1 Tax=Methanobrevibacter sp. TaxID=66852 RepID=UPI00388D36AC
SNSNIAGTYINNTASNAIIQFSYDEGLDAEITNAIFLNNNCTYEIYAGSSGVVVKDSWFGNNASNYMDSPRTFNVQMNSWLFLNATADLTSISVFDSSDVLFKLYSTNGTYIYEYENSKLPVVNLTLTATNGEVSNSTTLDKSAEYRATKVGQGSVTASVENAEYTIFFDNNKRSVDLSVKIEPQEISYGENTSVILDYNSTATGKVNITLTGKKYNKTFENLDLNKTIQLPDNILPDEYEVTVSYSGDDVFLNSSATGTLTVNKLKSDIKVKSHDIYVNDTKGVMFTVTLPENATGNLTISNGEMLNVSQIGIKDNGYLIVNITNSAYSVGQYNWTFTYSGDDIYENSEAKATANILIIPTEIIANTTSSLFVDDTAQITYNLTPGDAVGNIKFTSNDTSVVEVDQDGNIKAIGEGKAIITVTFEGSKNYTASSTNVTLTVSKIATEITLTNVTIELKAYQSIGDLAALFPSEAGNLKYVSNNEDIVLVSDDGIIYARKNGTATVTVSFAGDDKYKAAESKNITVTVTLNDASVSVENDTIDLYVDDTCIINATANPRFLAVYYASSNESVASVTEYGNVKAVGEGTAIITLTVGNGETYAVNSTNVTVTVSKISTEIITENETLDLKVNDKVDSGVSLNPSEAGNLTYIISNSSIIKLLDNQIIALSEGTATITYSFNGTDRYAAADNKTITVAVSLNDASVSVNNATLDLLVDDTFNLITTTEPKDLTVNFTSSNSSVVTVDKDGNIVAVSEGNATITVTVGGDGIYAENSTTVTVTVKKVPTEITVDSVSLDLFVGDETVIAANLTPTDAGNVSFTSSDENIVTVDDKGNVIANGKGQAIITVSFKGDNKYAAAENKTITVNVSLNDASVTVDNDTLDLKVDETYKINATKHPDTILLDITYTSSDETVATVDEKGVVTAVGEGSAIITVSVGDGEIYAENSTNVTVTVSKVPTEITVLNDTIVLEVNDEVSAGATLTPGDAGNLTYTSSNSSVVKVEDGKIIALAEGNATITVSFKGDNKYAAAENKTISVTVNLKKASIIAEPDSLELIIGEDGSIYVTTNPEDLDYIFTSSDESVVTVQSKNRVGKVLAVGEGNATITVTINEEAYVKNSTTVNIAVNRNDTLTVTAQNLTKYYKDPQKFTVTVTDTKGQAVSNKTVEITINGITYTRTTDENGTAKLNINLDSGEYPVSVNVDDITVNSTVTVKSTIDASDVVKIFRNDTQYNAKFIDSNANILANIQVSFNINGIIYNRTTDGNGTAKLNINLDAGTYIITATNPVTGEMKSDTITVISLIESDDLTKYYRNASQFVVRIHSADGGYVGAGEEIKFNINGVFYTRTTNETGHAKLNINLGQGNYTITTYYKDCSQGNNIEVLPILSANDLVMKYMDGSQFKAKLVDGQGKAYPKQTIKFNINGVIYNGKTDSDGVAKLNINIMAGQYIITSSYNDFNIANKITIRG